MTKEEADKLVEEARKLHERAQKAHKELDEVNKALGVLFNQVDDAKFEARKDSEKNPSSKEKSELWESLMKSTGVVRRLYMDC